MFFLHQEAVFLVLKCGKLTPYPCDLRYACHDATRVHSGHYYHRSKAEVGLNPFIPTHPLMRRIFCMTTPHYYARREPTDVELRIAHAVMPDCPDHGGEDAAFTIALLRRELALSLRLSVADSERFRGLAQAEQDSLLLDLHETHQHWMSFASTEAQANSCVSTMLRRRLQDVFLPSADQVS